MERAALEMERAARRHVEAELADQKALVAQLERLVQEFKRAKFGPRSEKLDADQLVDRIQHLVPTPDGGDDFVGIGCPVEGLRI